MYFSLIRFSRYFVWISLQDSNGKCQNIWCKGEAGSQSSDPLSQLFLLFSHRIQISLVCYYTSSFYSIILTALTKVTSSVTFCLYFGCFITLTIPEITLSLRWLTYVPAFNLSLSQDGNSGMQISVAWYHNMTLAQRHTVNIQQRVLVYSLRVRCSFYFLYLSEHLSHKCSVTRLLMGIRTP